MKNETVSISIILLIFLCLIGCSTPTRDSFSAYEISQITSYRFTSDGGAHLQKNDGSIISIKPETIILAIYGDSIIKEKRGVALVAIDNRLKEKIQVESYKSDVVNESFLVVRFASTREPVESFYEQRLKPVLVEMGLEINQKQLNFCSRLIEIRL